MPIEKLDELPEFQAKLTEREVVALTKDPSQLAMARDWSILSQKIDWVMDEVKLLHNCLVKHDAAFEKFERANSVWHFIRVVVTAIVGGAAGLYYVIQLSQSLAKIIH